MPAILAHGQEPNLEHRLLSYEKAKPFRNQSLISSSTNQKSWLGYTGSNFFLKKS